MSKLGKIARRTFLVGSVAVAGGVAFGIWKVKQAIPNPLHPDQGIALNPFIVIDGDGVTLITGRAEMGQGAPCGTGGGEALADHRGDEPLHAGPGRDRPHPRPGR